MTKDLVNFVDNLVEEGVLKTPAIIEAFKAVDRRDFVSTEYADSTYGDYPLSIGHGQTISQPYTVAFMLELLEPRIGERILDVGSGSAWTTALLAHIVTPRGHVWGIELVPELVEFGQHNIARYANTHVEIQQAKDELGLSEHAPFDKILVSAGDANLPKQLVDQLKIGGSMVIPIESAVWKVVRTGETETETEKYEGFAFVPLIREKKDT